MKYFISLFIIILASTLLTGEINNFVKHSNFTEYFILKITLIVIFIFWFAKFLHHIIISNWNEKKKNVALMSAVFILFIGLIEFTLTFIPKTSHTQLPLASITWEAYYNRSLNSNGFRDIEFERKDTTKPKIFFIGDSFTEGYGIKKKKQRFTDIAAQKLKDDYTCYNLGRNGIAMRKEFEILLSQKTKPSVVIWQYFFNDIIDFCNELTNCQLSEDFNQNIPNTLKWWIDRNYITNLIYHNYIPQNGYMEYINYFKDCLENKDVEEAFLFEFLKIAWYCITNDIKIMFLLVPNTINAEDSKKQDSKIEEFLEGKGILCLNLTETLANIPQKERIINHKDMHFSTKTHQIVADTIVNFAFSKNILDLP